MINPSVVLTMVLHLTYLVRMIQEHQLLVYGLSTSALCSHVKDKAHYNSCESFNTYVPVLFNYLSSAQ